MFGRASEVAKLLECASPLALWHRQPDVAQCAHGRWSQIEAKAAEDCRSPKPDGCSDARLKWRSFWSAPALWRFHVGTPAIRTSESAALAAKKSPAGSEAGRGSPEAWNLSSIWTGLSASFREA